MNMAFTLDSLVDVAYANHGPGKPLDMIVAADCNAINYGVSLLKISEWSLEFMQQVWDARNDSSIASIKEWWENAAVVHLLRQKPDLKQHVYVINQELLNAYPAGFPEFDARPHCFKPWKPGGFVLHLVAASKHTMLAKYVDAIKNATATVHHA